ncbi:FAMILY REGULATORY PROTEIN putative [Salix koriyanagi]|uniref:FAMILY REGULATORY PROTEIN putative n=1 Tax=Salix koriyanagi TaxID=2511006 RepID=A0A9Q1AEE0_9ROSI|nr:FAMILY REGULATORY PROTEIN putative [Salix koriyanagi]
MSSATSLTVVSQCSVFPDKKSTLEDLKLSVCDLPMLSCHYIQKGVLFTRHPTLPIDSLISHLKQSLSQTLSHFPPLAGRFSTDSNGYIYITCNDAGVDFIHATANNISTQDILRPLHVPDCVRGFFAFESTVSYQGHYKPILAVQVTELADGVFVGCSVNHSVADGGPQVTFNENEPICERIFSFSREAILKLKSKVNDKKWSQKSDNTNVDAVELMGKQSNDTLLQIHSKGKVTAILESWFKNAVLKPQQMESNLSMAEISSFQSLCALLWRAVTRARKLNPSKTTTFRMAVNCRHRLSPKLDTLYFGNAIQSVPTHASAGDVLSRDLHWCAEQLNKTVVAHNDEMVSRFIEDWESNPRCFPLGNLDGASMTMGSSPRFPMYDNDFGWGRPLAVRSGKANKFDGKISAFPGREGNGTVDLEVVLAPEAMAGIESDHEFMQFVSL